MTKIEKQIRKGLPMVGYAPYGQVHAHSTGNPGSTAQNEADYMNSKDINSGFYTHVVGNGRIIQVASVNRGAWDVGGSWNQWGYASVELIESHKNKADFEKDYKNYVNLLRDLAKEASIPLKVDNGELGIISHAYATANQPNNGSDHIDPYPYLAKWGISKAQFKKDVEKGFESVTKKPEYWDKTGKYKMLKDDTFYCEKELKNRSSWAMKKDSVFFVDEVVTVGKMRRGAVMLGKTKRWITLNKSIVKKV